MKSPRLFLSLLLALLAGCAARLPGEPAGAPAAVAAAAPVETATPTAESIAEALEARRLFAESAKACEAALAAGDELAFIEEWERLRIRYFALPRADTAHIAESRDTLRRFQPKGAALLQAQAAESEKRGLIATAVWQLWSSVVLLNTTETPDRPIAEAIADTSTSPFAHAQRLSAEAAIELIPAVEGALRGSRIGVVVTTTTMPEVARSRNLPVLKPVLGLWEGDLRVSLFAKQWTSTYMVPALVPNTAAIEKWELKVAQAEKAIAAGKEPALIAAVPAPDIRVGQEPVYDSGSGPGGAKMEIGMRAVERETAASIQRREEAAATQRRFDEDAKRRAKEGKEAAKDLEWLEENVPPDQIMGMVPAQWTYEEKCQKWEGGMTRVITLGSGRVVQTASRNHLPSGGCTTVADPAHNVSGKSDALSHSEAMAQYRERLLAEDDFLDLVLRPLVLEQTARRIETRLGAVRAKGVSGAALAREDKLLRMLYLQRESPNLFRIVGPPAGVLQLEVSSTNPCDDITLDGYLISKARPFIKSLDPGIHALRASCGSKSTEETFMIDDGQELRIELNAQGRIVKPR